MSNKQTDFDQLCVNTIRTLSIDAVQQAKSEGKNRFVIT